MGERAALGGCPWTAGRGMADAVGDRSTTRRRFHVHDHRGDSPAAGPLTVILAAGAIAAPAGMAAGTGPTPSGPARTCGPSTRRTRPTTWTPGDLAAQSAADSGSGFDVNDALLGAGAGAVAALSLGAGATLRRRRRGRIASSAAAG